MVRLVEGPELRTVPGYAIEAAERSFGPVEESAVAEAGSTCAAAGRGACPTGAAAGGATTPDSAGQSSSPGAAAPGLQPKSKEGADSKLAALAALLSGDTQD